MKQLHQAKNYWLCLMVVYSLGFPSLARSEAISCRQVFSDPSSAPGRPSIVGVFSRFAYGSAARSVQKQWDTMISQTQLLLKRQFHKKVLANTLIVPGPYSTVPVKLGEVTQNGYYDSVYKVLNSEIVSRKLNMPLGDLEVRVAKFRDDSRHRGQRNFKDPIKEQLLITDLQKISAEFGMQNYPWAQVPTNSTAFRIYTDYGIAYLKPVVGSFSLADIMSGKNIAQLNLAMIDSLEALVKFSNQVKKLNLDATHPLSGGLDLSPSNLRWVETPEQLARFGLNQPSFVINQISPNARSLDFDVNLLLHFLQKELGELPARENSLSLAIRKLKELPYLDSNYILEVSIRSSLVKLSENAEKRFVPMADLYSIHPVDDKRPSSYQKFLERKNLVEKNKTELIQNGKITQKAIDRVLPSKNSIRAVRLDDNFFVIFDGNGRFKALEEGLGNRAAIEVEEWGPVSPQLKTEILFFMYRKGMFESMPSALRSKYLPMIGER